MKGELIGVTETAKRLEVSRQYILYLIKNDLVEDPKPCRVGKSWALQVGAKVTMGFGKKPRVVLIPRAGDKK